MTPTEIAQYAIIHISAEKIGMKEAAALFAMAFRPLTAKQVADAVDAEQRTITTRIQTLKRKGMIEAIHSVDGGVYYQLTDHGKTIIDGCIP